MASTAMRTPKRRNQQDATNLNSLLDSSLTDDTSPFELDPLKVDFDSKHTSPDRSVVSANSGHSNKGTKRKPHNKSRLGCATCKRRRVKCDETHPICKNCEHLGLECAYQYTTVQRSNLNIIDIMLFHHYTTVVCKTISDSGISKPEIWGEQIPQLAFKYPYLMHSILAFSATHKCRTEKDTFENAVVIHRGNALKMIREEMHHVTPKNLDALAAASILMILDSLANASLERSDDSSSLLPASTWLHHVRGCATILISVGPLPPDSRFYQLVNVDLSDLADANPKASKMQEMLGMSTMMQTTGLSPLECFDDELQDLYPVHTSSPYFHTLVYIDKLFHQRYRSDFILRVFSFPALLDNKILELLIGGDTAAQRIIRVYYKLVRSFIAEKRDSVWFLEGVAKVLPIDLDDKFGGLGFITNALPVSVTLENILASFDASILAADTAEAAQAFSNYTALCDEDMAWRRGSEEDKPDWST